MGTMNQRGSLGQQRKAQISNSKKLQTSKLQTLTGRFMERFHEQNARAMGAMNQRGSLGQQRKAQISNRKKIQQQSINT